jgi:hypothetical protein
MITRERVGQRFSDRFVSRGSAPPAEGFPDNFISEEDDG